MYPAELADDYYINTGTANPGWNPPNDFSHEMWQDRLIYHQGNLGNGMW
jgi:hypothetical protein